MKTTVVIPNYNGIKFLENCLKSATESTVLASIIVVDNGSVDGSRQLAENWPGVEVIAFSENQGFCKAVNAGIEAAKTPYVFLLNNDTTIEPDCIGALEAAMESSDNIFSVGAKMLSMYERDKIDSAGDLYSALGWAYNIGKGKPAENYTRRREVFSACGGAVLYRKELLLKTGLFDERHFAYLEDVDLGFRARIMGWRNVFEPAAVVYHAGSSFSGSRYNEFKIRLSSRNNIYLLYKNLPFLQQLINLPFLMAGFLIKILFFWKKGFGRIYVNGLMEGLKMSYSKEGRAKKVTFSFKNLKHYLKIQLELWINMFRHF